MMENYVKGEKREVEDVSAFPVLHSSVVSMRVNAGSRIRNIMGYAIKKMKEPDVKQMLWNGSGLAISKTVSCVEILKRKIKGLHQVTKIQSWRIEEYWEPKIEGLERLKVIRDIPAVTILLSKEMVDSTQSGYQASGCSDPAWLFRPYEEWGSAEKQVLKSGNSVQKRKRKHQKEINDSVKEKVTDTSAVAS